MKKRPLKEQVSRAFGEFFAREAVARVSRAFGEFFAREAVAREHARADAMERAAREARETAAKAHARADATERAARKVWEEAWETAAQAHARVNKAEFLEQEARYQLAEESRAAQARADAAAKQLLSEQAARARIEGVVGLDVSTMKRDLDVLKREREQIADVLSQALKVARPNELPPLKEEGLFLVAEAVVRALNAREPS